MEFDCCFRRRSIPHLLSCSGARETRGLSCPRRTAIFPLECPCPRQPSAERELFGCRATASLSLSGPPALFADGVAVEFDAVGVVDDVVEDGIGVGGLADKRHAIRPRAAWGW